MPYTLNLIQTADDYTPANTLVCASSDVIRVNLKVFTNGVFLSLGTTPGTILGSQQGQEVFYPPGLYSVDRYVATAAVRSAFPGLKAVVCLDAWRKGEISG